MATSEKIYQEMHEIFPSCCFTVSFSRSTVSHQKTYAMVKIGATIANFSLIHNETPQTFASWKLLQVFKSLSRKNSFHS